jgi:predicted metalloprotease with PDZ domain
MKNWHSPTYTVTLSQHNERGSMSGSGLTHAFEMTASDSAVLDEFIPILSHENFHYWNGGRIRYARAENRWFSEGFTNYYTYLFIARGGLWDRDRSLRAFSNSFQDYFHSPVSTAITFREAGQNFWDWEEYHDHFYKKGMLIGFMVDVKLRADSLNTRSLDGLMRWLDNKLYGSGQLLDDHVFRDNIEAYSGTDWDAFLDAAVGGKEWLDVNSIIRQGGMELFDKACERPDPGVILLPKFCSDGRPCGYSANSIDINGPAYAAGLRNGDHILQREISRQPGGTVRLVLRRGGTDHELNFRSRIGLAKCPTLRFVESATPTFQWCNRTRPTSKSLNPLAQIRHWASAIVA